MRPGRLVLLAQPASARLELLAQPVPRDRRGLPEQQGREALAEAAQEQRVRLELPVRLALLAQGRLAPRAPQARLAAPELECSAEALDQPAQLALRVPRVVLERPVQPVLREREPPELQAPPAQAARDQRELPEPERQAPQVRPALLAQPEPGAQQVQAQLERLAQQGLPARPDPREPEYSEAALARLVRLAQQELPAGQALPVPQELLAQLGRPVQPVPPVQAQRELLARAQQVPQEQPAPLAQQALQGPQDRL